MNRHGFLAALHEKLRPRTYLEIGVHRGQSLTLSRVPSIGIDPEFNVTCELQADVHLARMTSDEFFARPHPLAHLPINVLDLAFIDGMHLAEYSLRDYLAVERFTHSGTVVVFDDMLPRRVNEANRYRQSGGWTGDVYKALEALRTLRPDVVVIEVATEGSGTAVVLCPDASRNGVLEGYDDWLESAIVPDPQPVPQDVLKRTRAVDPEELLAAPGWDAVIAARHGKASAEEIRAAFARYGAARVSAIG
ncbi:MULTISPECIES: class I SAM-dependent methyltransferase [Nocardioides]|uniref:Class I SAM-dependent methyltransferase n=1 Tax=Nocardioides vastitatis TaxID=2568655 RepID=A0ABW0ZG53_9ACTN|nr:class I SAM-dependent methyltransferase [Nocardioides sp.]THI95343.1 class I SAM-dependent methyltransferase [Nocardioides sp.]